MRDGIRSRADEVKGRGQGGAANKSVLAAALLEPDRSHHRRVLPGLYEFVLLCGCVCDSNLWHCQNVRQRENRGAARGWARGRRKWSTSEPWPTPGTVNMRTPLTSDFSCSSSSTRHSLIDPPPSVCAGPCVSRPAPPPSALLLSWPSHFSIHPFPSSTPDTPQAPRRGTRLHTTRASLSPLVRCLYTPQADCPLLLFPFLFPSCMTGAQPRARRTT